MGRFETYSEGDEMFGSGRRVGGDRLDRQADFDDAEHVPVPGAFGREVVMTRADELAELTHLDPAMFPGGTFVYDAVPGAMASVEGEISAVLPLGADRITFDTGAEVGAVVDDAELSAPDLSAFGCRSLHKHADALNRADLARLKSAAQKRFPQAVEAPKS
jgi:hypothetical protein